MPEEKKYTYRVKPGRMFGAYNQHGPGDIVKLTENEAGGFLDKLQLVKESAPEPPAPDDEIAHLQTLTVPQLKQLPEYKDFENPKPTTKDAILVAIFEARGLEVPE